MVGYFSDFLGEVLYVEVRQHLFEAIDFGRWVDGIDEVDSFLRFDLFSL